MSIKKKERWSLIITIILSVVAFAILCKAVGWYLMSWAFCQAVITFFVSMLLSGLTGCNAKVVPVIYFLPIVVCYGVVLGLFRWREVLAWCWDITREIFMIGKE